ncbi:uncharacterized protein BDV14DRAFT_172332 [Aspergillus stella-maris]|uniref:uncharacterized protein n=1 Tax=Aspergillus stella-maris TaxID=1810926 RepID=UPI003CCCD098
MAQNRWLYHAAARLSRYDQRALTEIPTHRKLVIAFSSQQHQRHPAHTVASVSFQADSFPIPPSPDLISCAIFLQDKTRQDRLLLGRENGLRKSTPQLHTIRMQYPKLTASGIPSSFQMTMSRASTGLYSTSNCRGTTYCSTNMAYGGSTCSLFVAQKYRRSGSRV